MVGPARLAIIAFALTFVPVAIGAGSSPAWAQGQGGEDTSMQGPAERRVTRLFAARATSLEQRCNLAQYDQLLAELRSTQDDLSRQVELLVDSQKNRHRGAVGGAERPRRRCQ